MIARRVRRVYSVAGRCSTIGDWVSRHGPLLDRHTQGDLLPISSHVYSSVTPPVFSVGSALCRNVRCCFDCYCPRSSGRLVITVGP
jgi:hypothetical protein